MRRSNQAFWLWPGIIFCWVTVASASMETYEQMAVDFTSAEKAGQDASWSDRVDLAKEGLGFEGDGAQSRAGWVLTRPLAAGTAWRPAIGAGVDVTVSPAPSPIKMGDGSSYTPYGGTMYVRFGCDRLHWSNWQEMERKPPTKDAVTLDFHAAVGVPLRNRARYDALRNEYRKLDVPWVDDEEALARWIVDRESAFFAAEQPYVGYVQFLYETDFNGGRRLRSLAGTVQAGIGGLHQGPKDPAEYKKHEGPWRYVGLP